MLARSKIFASPRIPMQGSARCWPYVRGRLQPSEALPWARSELLVTPGRFSGFVSFQCFAERKIFVSPRFPVHGAERCGPDVRGRTRPCELSRGLAPRCRSLPVDLRFREFSMLCGEENFRRPSIFAARRGAMQAAHPQDRHGRACGDVDDRDDPRIESGDGHRGTRGSSRRRS
jgi:hypothetical protein